VVSGDRGVGVQLATILLDAGARLSVRDDPLRSTPLGWACRWGRVEIARLFLARGADPVEADAEPWATPRAWAQKMQQPEIVDLLNNANSTYRFEDCTDDSSYSAFKDGIHRTLTYLSLRKMRRAAGATPQFNSRSADRFCHFHAVQVELVKLFQLPLSRFDRARKPSTK
jgi:hypothetical protein